MIDYRPFSIEAHLSLSLLLQIYLLFFASCSKNNESKRTYISIEDNLINRCFRTKTDFVHRFSLHCTVLQGHGHDTKKEKKRKNKTDKLMLIRLWPMSVLLLVLRLDKKHSRNNPDLTNTLQAVMEHLCRNCVNFSLETRD